eukprot:Gregarina_sp_Pseudo_9__5599@NODE_763_length_2248_cov_123_141693_g719_i0_p1_GENE_NODE_763_length_2248_cov_123_141693_g719_i0NODE_763_length_2248_cov_123_141693_g719_i0_p1_ORF_typecomplete_len460_score121_50_NODE_763_length_2248_cov_123_141693_g719_i0941473
MERQKNSCHRQQQFITRSLRLQPPAKPRVVFPPSSANSSRRFQVSSSCTRKSCIIRGGHPERSFCSNAVRSNVTPAGSVFPCSPSLFVCAPPSQRLCPSSASSIQLLSSSVDCLLRLATRVSGCILCVCPPLLVVHLCVAASGGVLASVTSLVAVLLGTTPYINGHLAALMGQQEDLKPPLPSPVMPGPSPCIFASTPPPPILNRTPLSGAGSLLMDSPFSPLSPSSLGRPQSAGMKRVRFRPDVPQKLRPTASNLRPLGRLVKKEGSSVDQVTTALNRWDDLWRSYLKTYYDDRLLIQVPTSPGSFREMVDTQNTLAALAQSCRKVFESYVATQRVETASPISASNEALKRTKDRRLVLLSCMVEHVAQWREVEVRYWASIDPLFDTHEGFCGFVEKIDNIQRKFKSLGDCERRLYRRAHKVHKNKSDDSHPPSQLNATFNGGKQQPISITRPYLPLV